MSILLIDTCGATGSIAFAPSVSRLADGPAPAGIACATFPGRTASERLVAEVRSLVGPDLGSLAAVAVVHGPGSFTGVRVGLSAAKGLCEALGLPLVAISRLAVLAHRAMPPAGRTVFPLLDAGRGEFYLGQYRDGLCLGERLVTRDQLRAAANAAKDLAGEPPLVVAFEGLVADAVRDLQPRLIAEPGLVDALPIALDRIKAHSFDDTAAIDANYLRRTDAEIFARPRASERRDTP